MRKELFHNPRSVLVLIVAGIAIAIAFANTKEAAGMQWPTSLAAEIGQPAHAGPIWRGDHSR